MPPIFHDIAGILGAVLYLGSYGALQVGVLRSRGFTYPALNLAAASLMLTSLAGSFNPWSATIEVCWIAFSILGLLRHYYLTSGLRFSDDERQVLETRFPGLEPYLAHRVFAAGSWREAAPGTPITQERQPVDALVYLASGRAAVCVNGREVAECGPGALIGELGALSRNPAIATVTITDAAWLFAIPAAVLRRLAEASPEIRYALDAGLGADARAKLISSNTRALGHPAAL